MTKLDNKKIFDEIKSLKSTIAVFEKIANKQQEINKKLLKKSSSKAKPKSSYQDGKYQELKIAAQEKRNVENSMSELNRCFRNFGNNHEKNIHAIILTIKSLFKADGVFYFEASNLDKPKIFDNKTNKKFIRISEIKELIKISSDKPIIINDFKKTEIYDYYNKKHRCATSSFVLYAINYQNKDLGFFQLTFNKKQNLKSHCEQVLNIAINYIFTELVKYNLSENIASSVKEIGKINRKVSLISDFFSSQTNNKKQITKLLSSFCKSMIFCLYAKDSDSKFKLIANSNFSGDIDEIEQNIIFKLQLLRMTHNNKKRFYHNFKDDDLNDKIVKKYKICGVTSLPIISKKKYLGNLILLHQNNQNPSTNDHEFFNLLCLAAAQSLT